MSDRSIEPGPSGASTADSGKNETQPSAPLPSLNVTTTATPSTSTTGPASPRHARSSQPPGRGVELPSLQSASALLNRGAPLPPVPRTASFSAILNPAQPDDLAQTRRRKASHLESPPSSVASLPPINADAPVGAHGGFGVSRPLNPSLLGGSSSEQQQQPQNQQQQGRRILTPRSPAIHRTASLSQLNLPPSSIPTQQSPYAPSPRHRAYAPEPGSSGVPLLPTPPAGARQGYGFPPASAPLTPSDAALGTAGSNQPSRALSPSVSPRTSSYSPYDQPGRETSSPGPYGPSGLPTLSAAYSTAGENLMRGESHMPPMAQDRQRAVGIPISSAAGQNVYQMMTLETTSGTVQLPVDVQAASRVADEKRRRNAGASARFRARRKEKERESSSTIAKLELQVKNLTEDCDFYRRERGYLAGVVLQVPGGDRHFPRPPSPRHRRPSSVLAGSSGSGYLSGQDMSHSPIMGEGRNVRRRTSTLSLPRPISGAMHPVGGQGVQPGYLPTPYGPPSMQQPHGFPIHGAGGGSLPPPVRSQHPSPIGPPPPMHGLPQTPSWTPYSNEARQMPHPDRPRDPRPL